MNFLEAMERLKKGVRVRRKSWSPGMYLQAKKRATLISITFPDGRTGPWVYGQVEKDAEDWETQR